MTGSGGVDDFDSQVTSVAALGEPVRRDLYRFVVASAEPVSREQAAAGVGIAHHVAKFHLDRLEADGLLEVEYRRPPGRSGPGAGRPAKLYRRAHREIEVSLPARRYDLAGRVMAEAITSSAAAGSSLDDALRVAARAEGARLGDEARRAAAGSRGGSSSVRAIADVLADHGFEPRVDDDGITLANCPFHSLAQDYTDLVCGINHDLIDGLLESAGERALQAHLQPAPDRCCVTLARARR